jgi:hypothetical protein
VRADGANDGMESRKRFLEISGNDTE